MSKPGQMGLPEAGFALADGDGLKQSVAKLKAAFLQPARVRFDTVDKDFGLHPLRPGRPASAVETTERKRTVGSTESEGVRQGDVDLRLARGMRNIVQITGVIRIV